MDRRELCIFGAGILCGIGAGFGACGAAFGNMTFIAVGVGAWLIGFFLPDIVRKRSRA